MSEQYTSEDMAHMYVVEKLSADAIGERVGWGADAVLQRLRAAGVEIRNPRRPDISNEEVRRLYKEEKLPLRAVGARLGISAYAVLKRLEKMGVERRDRHGR